MITLCRLAVAVSLLAILAGCGSGAANSGAPTPIIIVVTATPAPATPAALAVATVPPPPPPTAAPPTTAPPTAAPPTARPPTAAPTFTPTRAATRAPAPTPTLPTIETKFPPEGVNVQNLDIQLVDRGFSLAGMTALTFQVLARVKGQPRDGGGIQDVTFVITDPQGYEVYRHTEQNAPYCAFQEATGTICRVLPARQGLKWRNSDNNEIVNRTMTAGPHTLRVTVNGKNGELWNGQFAFSIR